MIGNAILVLVLPILTRLYGPDAFGMLGVYMSLLDVLAVAACLRLDLATPCLLYTSPSPRDATLSRMPSSA